MASDFNNDYNNGYHKDYNNYNNDPGSDYGSCNHSDYDGSGSRQGSSRALSSAALGLGIAALLFCSFIYTAVPLACLSIILALLSRGRSRKNSAMTAAIIMDVMAIALSAAITIAAFHTIFSSPILRSQFNEIIEYYSNQLYGEGGPDDPELSGLPGTGDSSETDRGSSKESEESDTSYSDESDSDKSDGRSDTFQSGGAFV